MKQLKPQIEILTGEIIQNVKIHKIKKANSLTLEADYGSSDFSL